MAKYQIGPLTWHILPEINWVIESSKQFLYEERTKEQTEKQTKSIEWTIKSLPTRNLKAAIDTPTLFSSHGSWVAHGRRDKFQIELQNQGKLSALLNIHLNQKVAQLVYTELPLLRFPLDEMLALFALSRERALFSHSCSLFVDDRGYVFGGVSGAGKSTLAHRLDGQKIFQLGPIAVGCDERNILFCDDLGAPQVSASPWYGTGNFSRNLQAPLKALVLLDPAHGALSLNPLDPQAAAGELLRTLFLPQFDPVGIQRGLEGLDLILQKVPVYKLSYNKDSDDVISFLGTTLFSQGYGSTHSARSMDTSSIASLRT